MVKGKHFLFLTSPSACVAARAPVAVGHVGGRHAVGPVVDPPSAGAAAASSAGLQQE